MTQLHPTVEAYLQSIQRMLDAPKEDRERLLSRLSHAVSTYCEENPEATAEDIATVFGSPVDCAAALMAECDPAKVAGVRKNKRRLYVVIAVLAILLAAMVIFYIYADSTQVKYVETYITEDTLNVGGALS